MSRIRHNSRPQSTAFITHDEMEMGMHRELAFTLRLYADLNILLSSLNESREDWVTNNDQPSAIITHESKEKDKECVRYTYHTYFSTCTSSHGLRSNSTSGTRDEMEMGMELALFTSSCTSSHGLRSNSTSGTRDEMEMGMELALFTSSYCSQPLLPQCRAAICAVLKLVWARTMIFLPNSATVRFRIPENEELKYTRIVHTIATIRAHVHQRNLL
ncbi:hypothetical protein BJ508DRAFT_310466 [Ascobolus immersus RN42]|uniref:Uncharacterized protein n=1 Tax=Ascobolus immersus RN42 TaxID=1160509 RepID=A0A3N4HYL7_ASCIM|nr:hypothetical protein BJ508DRAFT_310466 [Ascobolus immersus RN42]